MPQKKLEDFATQNQIIIERVKAGKVRKFETVINKMGAEALKILRRLDVDDLSQLSIKRLNKTLAEINKIQSALLFKQLDKQLEDFDEFSDAQVELEEKAITATNKAIKLSKTAEGVAFKRALKTPMSTDGNLLEPFIRDWAKVEVKTVNKAIRRGWAEGRTIPEMVREIKGTKTRNFKDGILAGQKRHANAVVRTATQHVSSTARQAVWANNSDIVEKYKWSSTLDSRTTVICRHLDGQVFEVGKGRIPPAHINCRSSTVPVLAPEFDFLDRGAKRAAKGGAVPASQTYYTWLKNQNKETQLLALGKDRTDLLRRGGLSAKRFGELQLNKNFKAMTLADMKKLEPEAFMKADL